MICALLVFQTPNLPAPLVELSPWLDWLGAPRDDVYARLGDQHHRRFVKTHTPLDGLPLDPRATYIVVGRHPLDMAVSLYHQGDNLDRDRMRDLTGRAAPPSRGQVRPSLHQWLVAWVDWQGSPRDQMDSMPGVLSHLSGAWARRDEPNIILLHYDDLAADLEGEMRGLARLLQIEVADASWPVLVRAGRFEQMQARADQVAPDTAGILKDRAAFFRRGSSGAGREILSADEHATYRTRARNLVPPDLFDWLHRDDPPPA